MNKKITRVEVLIIFLVIAGLSWITYNQFELAQAKSRDIDRKNSLNELGQIIRLFYADYDQLPQEKLINNLWGKEWKDGDYVYLKKLPQENNLKKQYCYLIEEGGKSFSLLADLENKSDKECEKNQWQCGGENYCYKHLMEAETVK